MEKPAQAEKLEPAEKPALAEKLEPAEKLDLVEKLEPAEKPAQAEKPEQVASPWAPPVFCATWTLKAYKNSSTRTVGPAAKPRQSTWYCPFDTHGPAPIPSVV